MSLPTPSPLPVTMGSAPRAVLDTQIVLDWLVFDDASTRPLADAIQAGRIDWVSEAGAVAELHHVLARTELAHYNPNPARVDAALAAHCRLLPTPTAGLHGLICRDRDDQRFIDLALACGAAWLFSRDKAVLALAKRARPRGLQILQPSRWQP